MHDTKKHIHPRVYQKTTSNKNQNELTLSATVAGGILLFTFVQGILLGSLFRKQR